MAPLTSNVHYLLVRCNWLHRQNFVTASNRLTSAEHCYARLLSQMYSDQANIRYINFLRPMLVEIKTVKRSFIQRQGTHWVSRDLEELYLSTRESQSLVSLDWTVTVITLSKLKQHIPLRPRRRLGHHISRGAHCEGIETWNKLNYLCAVLCF